MVELLWTHRVFRDASALGDMPARWRELRASVMAGGSDDLVLSGAVEAPGADAAGGFCLVHDEFQAVSKVEGHVAFRERLEVAGLAGFVRATEAVVEKGRPEALALASGVDAEQA